MRALITFVLCLGLSGCLSDKKTFDKQHYRFVESSQLTLINQSMIVKRPSAMGILGNRPMVAQNSDGSLVQMQYNFWLESPKILLHNYLEKHFVEKSNDQSPYTMYTHIINFEKHQQTAVIGIKFMVRDSGGQLVLNKTYEQQQVLNENTITAFVDGISTMLENIVQQLISDLP